MHAAQVGEVPPRPEPVPPLITHVVMDTASRDLYARVLPDPVYPKQWSEEHPVMWVRAYHPAFDGGYCTLVPVPNAYEDPYGMHCELPVNASELTTFRP